MAEVIWSARALQDIDDIAAYIAKDSPRYAQEQVKLFIERAEILTLHPLIGRMVPELKEKTIRQLLCGYYRIIYEILNEDQVAVITVHHAARLLRNNTGIKKHLRRKRR
jgi:addiction module RelE/StbE family toxin